MDPFFGRGSDKKTLGIMLEKIEQIYHIKDINMLLNNILLECRIFTNAEAGSIFLVEKNILKFSYVQNDVVFKKDILSNKYIYTNREVDISEKSIVGYSALTGKSLSIPDAYIINKKAPYSFNAYFDEISSYRTKSILVIPIKNTRGEVIGVIELINAKSGDNKIVTFTSKDRMLITQFAYWAAVSIERALMVRDIVHRMIKLSEMRDPEETQKHVNRVSSYSVEIYQKWAENHNVPLNEINSYKDILKIASMIHDIGKVGIADAILKKKDQLTDDEFNTIKYHTIYGARLFENSESDWERMAAEICLNHHEKWDGTGYPGRIETINSDQIKFSEGKKSAEIPLSARIVAISDVYDALINRRVYKDAWEEDRVLFYLKQQSGIQFDPELVVIFFEIYDIIKAIRSKWES